MLRPPPSLHRALLAHRPGRGKLYPPEVRTAVIAFSRERGDEGAGLKEIAAELGLRVETVRRWCDAAAEPSFKRVEVVDESRSPSSGLCLVFPSGHRLEGMTAHDAIAVLRGLGCS